MTTMKKTLPDITKSDIGSTLTTFGWIKSIRTHKKTGTFIDLYYGFKTIKCLSPETLINLTPHTSLLVTGEVKENYSTKDAFEFEFHITDYQVHTLAPSFPINKESSAHTQLKLGHLYLQTNERILFLRARNELMHCIRDWYYKKSYCEVTTPTLVQTQVEGGSTLFHLKYYGEDAYLTQSSQLYLETVVASAMKCYCIMPSYRAEKSHTTRHLSEYTHVEAELGDMTFDKLMDEIEDMIRDVVNTFYDKMIDEIKEVYKENVYEKISSERFKRITYEDAIELLRAHKVMRVKEVENEGKEDEIKNTEKQQELVEYKYGDDIADKAEIKLVEILGNRPVFLTHFPVEFKPFYCRRKIDEKEEIKADEEVAKETLTASLDNLKLKKREVTESCDLLWPTIGETLGGSMRAEKYEEVMEGFEREGIDPEKYYWYSDIRLFGASTTGGYGLGFERFMRGIMKYDNVNKACLYPRFPGRCEP